MLLFLGSLAGWCAAYGGSLLTARTIANTAAITMVTAPDWRGLLIIPVITVCGMVAGLIPAALLGRKDVSQYL
jgi:nitrate reductase gamma subunit